MTELMLTKETLQQLEELAQTGKFPPNAYEFVLLEFEQLMLRQGFLPEQRRGVTDQTLCWKLHDRALSDFGDSAREKLAAWNVVSTKDFGEIVYELVDVGLIGMEANDSKDNFEDVFEFHEAFQEPHFKPARMIEWRWRVSTLFAITTVVAIAFAGVSNGGFQGAMGTLFSTWFMIIGGFTLYTGVTDRSNDWLLAVSIGAIFFGLGFIGFLIHAG